MSSRSLSGEEMKSIIEQSTASGKVHFDSAIQAMQNSDLAHAMKQRNLAIEEYQKARNFSKIYYGDDSVGVANLLKDMADCYKWIPYAQTNQEQMENVITALNWYQSTAKIWEEKIDLVKYNKQYSNLCVDIGGLFYMVKLDDEALSWRLKAYKALERGNHDLEELGKIELALRITYKELNTPDSFEQFMSNNSLPLLIESASSEQISLRFNRWTVKLKGVNTPFVWEMG